ncbi:hypothetical protein ACFPEL_05275 [Actinomycetospora chibensis]|uniref:DUF7144 domain-containing protein n=1 Tax=Actinomycetospora chibensis TaxID=663606 RepID=A0ABV9RET0_9PSEU|nr:hypothetical protein [Actinomycetospora chibensis]
MTEQRTPTATNRQSSPPPRSSYEAAPVEDADTGMGWVRFAGVIMVVIGGFGVIEGFVALLTPNYYVTAGGAVLTFSLTGWGWVHIILGALVLATGFGLLGTASSWARVAGIVFVTINMLVQFAWLPAYPLWGILAIVLDVVVLYALVATWGQRTDW